MADAIEQRRLAAIMFTDMVGYSALAQRSEALALVLLHVWALDVQRTRTGVVILPDAEKNGEMLQVLARLWHRTHDERSLERGRGIVEAYVNEAMPANGGLPPRRFDFAAGKATEPRVWLRDHGNEMIAGLAEWMLVEREAPDSRSARYAPAVEAMLDRVIESGRRADGMWRIRVGEEDGPNGLLNDNWGYLSGGFIAYALTLAEGDPRRQRYIDAAHQAMRGAATHRGGNWEQGRMDGYADTLEGGMSMLSYVDDAPVANWVDEEMGRLLAYARPDGFVTGMYLDGNFVRTALLYARWKTAGVLPLPWRADVRLGAAREG